MVVSLGFLIFATYEKKLADKAKIEAATQLQKATEYAEVARNAQLEAERQLQLALEALSKVDGHRAENK